MTQPFMRAYTELLVKTCHRRNAFAMGGMAAFIPNRREPEVTAKAVEKVREDKSREAGDGFDGSWVAHPDLVELCAEEFTKVLGERPNQVSRQREDVSVTAEELLNTGDAEGDVTEEGVRANLYVAVYYTAVWLSGNGAVAIHNLMEDAATAEISRSQVWQQIYNGTVTADTGRTVTRELVESLLDEEVQRLRQEIDDAETFSRYFEPAADVVRRLVLDEQYLDFLTLPAYEHLTEAPGRHRRPAQSRRSRERRPFSYRTALSASRPLPSGRCSAPPRSRLGRNASGLRSAQPPPPCCGPRRSEPPGAQGPAGSTGPTRRRPAADLLRPGGGGPSCGAGA